jgi:hypothetical protein
VNALLSTLCPELASLPPAERANAFRAARKVPYDTFELLGIAAGLIVATLFLTHALGNPASLGARVAAACPVVAVSIGPFVLRRVRRGLRLILERA